MVWLAKRDGKQFQTRVEWPTIVLAIVIYGSWLLITRYHARLPVFIVASSGGWLIAWHGSLQHETIHGHPTRWRWMNLLVGAIPLALWLPYACYRRDHIDHHQTPHVTDPVLDPESRYLGPMGGFRDGIALVIARLQASLVGRLLLGPPLLVAGFLLDELHRFGRTPRTVLQDWAGHSIGVIAVLAWLHYCGFDLDTYLLLFLYPGMALTLLRSFAEHRAAPVADHRVAIVESAGPLALLFLNNNLHAAHHRAPGMPWYALPRFYARNRAALLQENGGLLYRGYGEIVRRFAWRRHDTLVHPDYLQPGTG